MGRNSSGNRINLSGDGGAGDISIKNVESLIHIKDPRVYKDVKAAISRFHSALGVRTKDVKIADLGGRTGGCWDPSDNSIKLNKKFFNLPKKKADAIYNYSVMAGQSTKTNNRGISSVVLHELGHAAWSTEHKSANAVAARKQIEKLYNTWKKESDSSRAKKGYGKYASTNIDEFFAETAMKAVSGSKDKYTKAVKDIVKKYKL